MAKLGRQFELVVSDVVCEMDPSSIVRQGEWVEGPDGSRELDVIIEGAIDGVPRRIQIECRDYSPDSRRIGIAHIDALDSKHRDLGMDVSLLCSNAGFSVDAKRKAKRLGIGLIGILREGDTRIRYRIMDEIYIRRIDVVPQSTGFTFVFENPPPPRDDLRIEEILYDGVPVINWLIRRVLIFLGSNPVVRGIHSLRFRFKHPMDFALPSGQAIANNIGVQFEISGQWIAQSIEIDATCGLYDWMHQTIRMGPGQTKITYKDVKFGEGGTSIAFPPDFDPDAPTKDYAGNEVSLWIVDIGGLDTPEDIPQMDEFVMDEDLELVHRDLRPETCRSW